MFAYYKASGGSKTPEIKYQPEWSGFVFPGLAKVAREQQRPAAWTDVADESITFP